MEGHWVQLKEDKAYEINIDSYPYEIRRIGKVKPIKKGNKNGYKIVNLNRKSYYLHRIIANNFIDNPNNDIFVDHINGLKFDYRINNLRWVSRTENNRNRTFYKGVKYQFVDELEEHAITIDKVNDWYFEDYYLVDDEILYYDGVKYRYLGKYAHGKQWNVSMIDIYGVQRSITKYQIEKALNITIE